MNDFDKEYRRIKKSYGEEMAKLCRENAPCLFDTEGLISNILEKNFMKNKELINDIINSGQVKNFKMFLLSQEKKKNRRSKLVDKNPFDLMKEAGYILYKCETEEDIQKFKYYYTVGEELCSFKLNRSKDYHVFFAIKENVDEIKRSENPKRQDEYGTSVLSIQFDKGENNVVSIKNRYNHTVINADATFSNDLDNIIPGLTVSFEKEFNFDINPENYKKIFCLDNYVLAKDGKRYKYTHCINGRYYCVDNNVIVNGIVYNYDKEKYILAENYLINLEDKTITDMTKLDCTFINYFSDIEKIKVNSLKNGQKLISIKHEDVKLEKKSYIILNSDNTFNSIYFPYLYEIGSLFMIYQEKINTIILNNTKSINVNFMAQNTNAEYIYIPKLTEVKENFLISNTILKRLYAPNLQDYAKNFLSEEVYERLYNTKENMNCNSHQRGRGQR